MLDSDRDESRETLGRLRRGSARWPPRDSEAAIRRDEGGRFKFVDGPPATPSPPLRTLGSVFDTDSTVLEAVSWRLASELLRRHPRAARLIRGHPGGGQYDLLWILQKPEAGGDIRLNRNGSIQIWGRFDGQPEIDWQPTPWDDYVRSDPRDFLGRLETAAGLIAPATVPPATATTLTYRVLAALAATAIKSVHPIEIQQGYIDTSGYGGGPNRVLGEFDIDGDLLRTREDDFFREPGYRFWIPLRDGQPLMALEQTSGTAWFPGRKESVDVMKIYRDGHRDAAVAAAELLRHAIEARRRRR